MFVFFIFPFFLKCCFIFRERIRFFIRINPFNFLSEEIRKHWIIQNLFYLNKSVRWVPFGVTYEVTETYPSPLLPLVFEIKRCVSDSCQGMVNSFAILLTFASSKHFFKTLFRILFVHGRICVDFLLLGYVCTFFHLNIIDMYIMRIKG